MAAYEEDSEKIQVYLIEGYRTVIVDSTVKFLQVIDSITERLSAQYAENHNKKTPTENRYGWIFGIRYFERNKILWLHPEMTHGEFVERICPKDKTDKGRLELRVRYFPQKLYDIDRDYSIIFTLLYKQVFHHYMSLDNVPVDLAVKLAVLELRRKFPDLYTKAASLIWHENDNEISFRNFFPVSVINQNKLKDLRRDVKREYSRIAAEGIKACDAALMFLELIKAHLFEFDREMYHVKLGQGWSVKVPVVIGPDDQISHLDASNAHRSIRMTDFRQISEIIVNYEPECRITLAVQSKTEPLILTCDSTTELDNLADLIDGYCRGTRSVKQGTIITHLQARELPNVPYSIASSESYSNSNIPSNFISNSADDDDYAEIGEQEMLIKFNPAFEIDRKSIQILGAPIGRGQFGNVYKASLNRNHAPKLVAVKSSQCQDESNEVADRFIEEARIMSKFSHPHIIQLIGVCIDRSPIFIVMELCEKGSLREYLQKNECAFDTSQLQLIRYVKQLASALAYLESQSFVHRDIAARNLLMYDIDTIKLGDFGLSRLLEDAQSYYVASNGKMPIKWMAPESINFRKFTTASDVWMFGVCTWEIMSCGTKPFSRIKNNDVIGKLENGDRLHKPDLCPKSLFQLLEYCWKYNPTERPSAAMLSERIEDIIEKHEASENSLYENERFHSPIEEQLQEPEEKVPLSRNNRNPTIPSKTFTSMMPTPKELLEDQAVRNLENEEKRQSRILTDLEREAIEEQNNQAWLEQNMRGGRNSLKRDNRPNSFGSSSLGSSSLERNKAPAKPPRSTRSSSSSMSQKKGSDEEKSPISSPKSTTPVQEIENDTRNHAENEPLVDEIPKITLSPVELPKFDTTISRENDKVFQSYLELFKQYANLHKECRNNTAPDVLLKFVANIGHACRDLSKSVDEYVSLNNLSGEIIRQIELEKKSLNSGLKQVVNQMKEVQKFNDTKASQEYKNCLANAASVLRLTASFVLDTVDKSRAISAPETES